MPLGASVAVQWLGFSALSGGAPCLGFPGGSDGKESTCNAGELGVIPGLRRSLGEENGHPLQYWDRGAWQATLCHGVTKSWT